MKASGIGNKAGVFVSNDTESVGAVFRDAAFIQISPGTYRARREYAAFDGMLCFHTRWNQKLLINAETAPGYYMFVVPASPSVRLDYFGVPSDESRIAFSAPGSEVDAVCHRDNELATLFIPEAMLDSLGPTPFREHLPGGHVIECDPALGRGLISCTHRLVARCLANESAVESAAMRRVLVSRLMGALLTCTDDGGVHPAHEFASGRRIVLRRALDHAERARWRIGAAHLAASVGVAQRTLQLAFKEGLGVSPVQFLRWRRLHEVRRELRATTPEEATVRDVALRWGFTHLGRFASDYRRLFGDLPSDTLRGDRPGFVPPVLRLGRASGDPVERR